MRKNNFDFEEMSGSVLDVLYQADNLLASGLNTEVNFVTVSLKTTCIECRVAIRRPPCIRG